MTLVATYNQPEARVELVTTGLVTAGAAIFTIERATDLAGPWTGVRGAVLQNAVGNGAQTWYDYEYTAGPGVTNYYRVVGVAGVVFVAVGTSSQPWTSGSTTYAPGLPAGLAAGDLMMMVVKQSSQCNSVDGWFPSVPGWTLITAYFSNIITAFYMRVATASEVAPTFPMPLTASSLDVGIAQIAAFRNARPVILGQAVRNSANQPASTTQVGFPALAAPPEDHAMLVTVGTTVDPWTSVAPTASWTQIDDAASTDRTAFACTTTASLVWQYMLQGAAASLSAGVMVITGGSHSAATKNGHSLAISYDPTNAATSVLFSDDVDTPLIEVWLKDPLRPPRNMVVQVASPSQIQRASRSGLFDIKGAAAPIEVSEIRRERAWTQRWVFTTFAELDALLELFSSGRTLLLHVPARGDVPDCPPWPRDLPGGYIAVGTTNQATAPDAPIPGTIDAPVQIVAAPVPEIDFIEVPVP